MDLHKTELLEGQSSSLVLPLFPLKVHPVQIHLYRYSLQIRLRVSIPFSVSQRVILLIYLLIVLLKWEITAILA